MRVYDNGSFCTVRVTADEVEAFRDRWPGCSLRGRQSFEFDKSNGDLVGRTGEGEGAEEMALMEDAKAYARKHCVLKS